MTPSLTLLSVPAPANRAFVAAWIGWRGTALVPRRAELDLVAIKTAIPTFASMEWRGADDVRFLAAGYGLLAQLGFDPVGRDCADLTDPRQWPIRRHRIAAMIERPCGGMTTHWQPLLGRLTAVVTVTLPLAGEVGVRDLVSPVGPLDAMPTGAEAPLAGIARLADDFQFIDIGAGVPEAIEPPAA